MTDNEIIKALEALLNREYPEDIEPTAVCTVEFLRGIYNFIDRLQDEVCYFDDRIDTINTEKNEIINRQKAEIAVLKSDLVIKTNEYENTKGLYENAIKISQKMHDKLVEAYKKLQNAKSEAIKEFAERLKLRFSGTLSCSGGAIARAIDNLVKEMTEKDDD